MDFCHLQETNEKKKDKNQSLNTELDFSKIISKKVIPQAAEATGKILGEKIAE